MLNFAEDMRILTEINKVRGMPQGLRKRFSTVQWQMKHGVGECKVMHSEGSTYDKKYMN